FSTAAEVGLPNQFDVTYTLTKGPLTLGEMTRSLTPNGDGSFVYESHSKPIGYARWFTKQTLVERSTWIYHNSSLRPLDYRYDRSGGGKERHVKLDFDWEKGRVTNHINNDPWKMDIPENAMDKLLYHLALMHDLQIGKEKLHYQVADGGSLKNYEFEILGWETIKTDNGVFETIKLKRPGRRETILWCAAELNFVPVRIEQQDKHGLLRMSMTGYSGITRQSHKRSENSVQQAE
ncbi:DUF3108 domain-containing protein, partial [Pseudomonadota bacterium]